MSWLWRLILVLFARRRLSPPERLRQQGLLELERFTAWLEWLVRVGFSDDMLGDEDRAYAANFLKVLAQYAWLHAPKRCGQLAQWAEAPLTLANICARARVIAEILAGPQSRPCPPRAGKLRRLFRPFRRRRARRLCDGFAPLALEQSG